MLLPAAVLVLGFLAAISLRPPGPPGARAAAAPPRGGASRRRRRRGGAACNAELLPLNMRRTPHSATMNTALHGSGGHAVRESTAPSARLLGGATRPDGVGARRRSGRSVTAYSASSRFLSRSPLARRTARPRSRATFPDPRRRSARSRLRSSHRTSSTGRSATPPWSTRRYFRRPSNSKRWQPDAQVGPRNAGCRSGPGTGCPAHRCPSSMHRAACSNDSARRLRSSRRRARSRLVPASIPASTTCAPSTGPQLGPGPRRRAGTGRRRSRPSRRPCSRPDRRPSAPARSPACRRPQRVPSRVIRVRWCFTPRSVRLPPTPSRVMWLSSCVGRSIGMPSARAAESWLITCVGRHRAGARRGRAGAPGRRTRSCESQSSRSAYTPRRTTTHGPCTAVRVAQLTFGVAGLDGLAPGDQTALLSRPGHAVGVACPHARTPRTDARQRRTAGLWTTASRGRACGASWPHRPAVTRCSRRSVRGVHLVQRQ